MYTLTTKGETPWTSEMLIRQVTLNGVPSWETSDGRTFPLVAGAEDPPPAPKTEDPPKPGDGDGEFDKDRAMATIKKLRADEKVTREQLKELETLKADQKKRDDADRSEAERLADKNAELTAALAETQGALKAQLVERAIESAAVKYSARNPAHVAKLLDRSPLELDDAGSPTNADQVVKDFLKANDYLVSTGKENGNTSGVPATPKPGAPAGHDDKVRANREKLVATGDYQPL